MNQHSVPANPSTGTLGRSLLKIPASAKVIRHAIQTAGGIRGLLLRVRRIVKREGLHGLRWRLFLLLKALMQFDETAARNSKAETADYEHWVSNYDTEIGYFVHARHLSAEATSARPLISVVLPVTRPASMWLIEAIDSVKNQRYPLWELIIVDDPPVDENAGRVIIDNTFQDARICLVSTPGKDSRAELINAAFERAEGRFVTLLAPEDRLHPLALAHIAHTYEKNPRAAVIYSDEDRLDGSGLRSHPYFKCDFNYELFLCQNMVGHLVAYKLDLIDKIGGCRPGFDGAEDYDLALRALDVIDTDQIIHLPKVLYHKRKDGGHCVPSDLDDSRLHAIRAVQEHLMRRGIAGQVVQAPEAPGMNRVRYGLDGACPMVEIVIPTKDRADLLQKCISSIFQQTTYTNYKVTIVDNDSIELETHTFLAELGRNEAVNIIHENSTFNYSKLNNLAAKNSSADYICLLNNDIEVISPGWLTEMVSHAIQDGVGAVGARLWYPDDALQHGGIILGIGGVAGHSHRGLPKGAPGYFFRGVLQQNFSAVTGACLLVSRSHYLSVGGLDEDELAVGFSDLDFCLKLLEIGLRNVWTPYAELYHYESATRGYENTLEKQTRYSKECQCMQRRWQRLLEDDPAYNPNLTLSAENYRLALKSGAGA